MQQAIPLEALYTVQEAAKRLRMGRNAVYAEIADGRLAHRKVGRGRRRILITEADCLAYLEICRSDDPPRVGQVRIQVHRPAVAKGAPRVPRDYFADRA
jgi:excisionase family DNA binding protein